MTIEKELDQFRKAFEKFPEQFEEMRLSALRADLSLLKAKCLREKECWCPVHRKRYRMNLRFKQESES